MLVRAASTADLKSLHHPPQARLRDFKSISGTRVIKLLVPFVFSKFVSEAAALYHELRKEGASPLNPFAFLQTFTIPNTFVSGRRLYARLSSHRTTIFMASRAGERALSRTSRGGAGCDGSVAAVALFAWDSGVLRYVQQGDVRQSWAHGSSSQKCGRRRHSVKTRAPRRRWELQAVNPA